MKLIQDVRGQWHNTAKIGTISVQPRGTASHGIVFEEMNSEGLGITVEVSQTEGEEGRREAHATLDKIVEWLASGYGPKPGSMRRSDTYAMAEKELRDKAEREAAIRQRQMRMVSEG